MFRCSRFCVVPKRFFATAAKEEKIVEEVAQTTVDAGKELEDRVARMLKKRGHLNIKKNQRMKDRNGNWSEFDIVYGWPIRHYVECKNYSHPVKLEMVAKFKEVLRLHRIPKSRGMFITTSTYTPRATTIGINCIDGAGLERLEKTATTALLIKSCIVLACCFGGVGLYSLLTQSNSPKIQKWREEISKKSQEVSKQKSSEMAVAVEKAKQKSEEILEATKQKSSEVVEKMEVMEKAKQKSSEILEATIQKGAEVVEAAKQTSATAVELAKQKRAEFRSEVAELEMEEKKMKKEMKKEMKELKEPEEPEEPEEEEWEAPSIDEILGTLFRSLLGYKR